jgi:hypothetical protein
VSCARKTSAPPAEPQTRDPCVIGSDSAERLDTFTVVLLDSVNPAHAPIPVNDSERMLFSLFSETLVRLDCRGQVRAGLASHWIRDESRREWIFALRDAPAGRPMTSGTDVLSAWKGRPAVLQALGIKSAMIGNNDDLVVTLRDSVGSEPRTFADPGLAVVHTRYQEFLTEKGWAVRRNIGWPEVIEYRVEPQGDPRDALDRGADLLVSRDPVLAEYAATRPALATFSLPWSRTYVLLEPHGPVLSRGMLGTDSARSSLARDAVRGEARAAEPPFWWSGTTCPAISSQSGASTTSSRVVYPRGSGVARDLAERIVALAGPALSVKSAALSDLEFAAALTASNEIAYVMALPRHSLAPCRDSSAWPPGTSVTPLIDTRARAIVRHGSPPLFVDWDGTIRVMPEDASHQGLP